MPTTLTLKNIPDVVYERLKASAQRNRHSLNSEAIVCLESALLPAKLSPSERLARAR
ncbi:FitA-like ribbon-helix-helix domain-containing protein [Synechococcus sp. Nb3U1]|uniref:FitA-like ribbon-helix-helix domain-containing protein n=1 Tax=Synechococcus sp. Nb3U1 TaxID=1914529 RepID=UPI003FCE7CE3